jgi:hypothetical protein
VEVNLRQLPDKFGRERAWTLVSTGTAVLGAMVAKRLMQAVYRATRNDSDPATPFDPTDVRFSWPEAILWAIAAGIGLGIAKVLSARLAALGWKAATHTPPPRMVEEPAVV